MSMKNRLKTRDQRLQTRRGIKIFLVFSFCYLIFAVSSFAVAGEVVSLKEVLSNPDYYHNKEITFIGEVVGEPLDDNGNTWINVLDGNYHIGVYIDNINFRYPLVEDIKHFGTFKTKGDIVKIKGIFHKNCPMHSSRDVHIYSLHVEKEGFYFNRPISSLKKEALFKLAIICLTLAVIYFIKVKYVRRD